MGKQFPSGKGRFFLASMFLYLTTMMFIQYPITTVLKSLPIIVLIIIAVESRAIKANKVLLIFALGFSLLGDVALSLPINNVLKIGILFFIFAHLTYIILFFKEAKFQVRRIQSFLFIFALACVVYCYYLWPHLKEMAIPTTVYFCFLSLMVFSAFQVQRRSSIMIGGACLFLLSDFALAINQFIQSNNLMMSIFVMLTYYLAQFLLVIGVLDLNFNVLFLKENTIMANQISYD